MEQQENQVREELRAARSSYEDKSLAFQNSTSRGVVLEALMQACKAGALSGVHGRLGDLGRIDDQYDVAVTTACRSLNDIVVENDKVGEKCVAFLKFCPNPSLS